MINKVADILIYGGIAVGSLAAGYYKGAAKANGISMEPWVQPVTFVGIPIATGYLSYYYRKMIDPNKPISGKRLDDLGTFVESAFVGAGALGFEAIGEMAGYFITKMN